MSPQSFIPFEDILYLSLIKNYTGSPRYIERQWLADEIRQSMEDKKKQLILITGEPGTGKSAFLSYLLDKNPDWLRYFIRRDQQTLLFSGSPSRRSFLLQIGFQLAGFFPDLFSQQSITLDLHQEIGTLEATAEATGVKINRLVASPFTQTTIKISQKIREQKGKFTGLSIDKFDADPTQIDIDDLENLAFYRPCRSLKSNQPEKKIVICIDALDELRYHETSKDNIIDWLSTLSIPDNVVFIVTSRPDDDILSLWRHNKKDELAEISINTEDPLVIEDLHRFASKLVQQGSVSSYLQRKKIPVPDFIQAVVKKSDGNIGYLDAIGRAVDESRDDPVLDQVLDLTNLPSTIQDLYAVFLLRIKKSVRDDWLKIYLPILGVLCVAREPLTQDQIFRFGTMDCFPSAMTDAVEKFRQFLDYNETNCTYRLYHATLPEFLTHEDTKNNRDTRGLYIDPREWHEKIAISYGRVQKHQWDLKKLKSVFYPGGTKKRNPTDTYGLFHLVDHLVKGGLDDDLHSLLAEEETDNHTTKNFWFSLKESENIVWSYKEDIERAWKQADENDVAPVSRSLSLQIRYALIESSICSRADCIPPQLLRVLISTGTWDAEKALHHIRQISDHQHRARSLAAISSLLPPALIERSYDCIQEIKYDLEKINPLIALLDASTDPGWKNRIASDILLLIGASEYDQTRSVTLNQIGPMLPIEKMDDAFQMAMKIPFDDLRAQALAGLIPFVPEKELSRIKDVLVSSSLDKLSLKTFPALILYSRRLPEAEKRSLWEKIITLMQRGEFENPSDFPEIFSRVTGEVPESFLPLLVHLTKSLDNPMRQASAVAVLLPRCTAEDRSEFLRLGMNAVDQIKIGGTQPYKVQLRTAFLPALSSDEKQSVFAVALREAEDTHISQIPELAIALLIPFAHENQKKNLIADAFCEMIRSPWGCRSDVIESISPFLDESQKEIMVRKILLYDRENDRVDALCSIVKNLSPELILLAIQAGYSISDPDLRYRLLENISPYLPKECAGEALAVVNEIRDLDEQGEVICAFAERISPQKSPLPFQQIISTISRMKNPLRRIRALHRQVRWLPEAERGRVWTEIIAVLKKYDPRDNDFYTALSLIAPDIPDRELDNIVLIIDGMANASENEYFRRKGLLAILPKIPPSRKTEAVEGIFDVSMLSNRAQTLVNSLPYIPVSDHVTLFNRILAKLDEEQEPELSRVITVLVRVLPRDAIIQVMENIAVKIINPHYRALALIALIPGIPAEKQEYLVKMITNDPNIQEDWEIRAGLLDTLAKEGNLNHDLVDRAKVSARSIPYLQLRAQALVFLLPLLDIPVRKEIAGEALLLCNDIPSVPDKIQLLLGIGSQIGFDGPMMDLFWNFYRQLPYYKDRPVALLGILPFLQSDEDRFACLTESLVQGAQWVWDRDPFRGAHDRKESWYGIFIATKNLPIDLNQSAWQKGLHALANRSRPDLLLDLSYFAPFLMSIGGEDTFSSSLPEIKKACTVWQ